MNSAYYFIKSVGLSDSMLPYLYWRSKIMPTQYSCWWQDQLGCIKLDVTLMLQVKAQTENIRTIHYWQLQNQSASKMKLHSKQTFSKLLYHAWGKVLMQVQKSYAVSSYLHNLISLVFQYRLDVICLQSLDIQIHCQRSICEAYVYNS